MGSSGAGFATRRGRLDACGSPPASASGGSNTPCTTRTRLKPRIKLFALIICVLHFLNSQNCRLETANPDRGPAATLVIPAYSRAKLLIERAVKQLPPLA